MKVFVAVLAFYAASCSAQFISPYAYTVAGPWAAPYGLYSAPYFSPVTVPVSTQYHSQDELGQFTFGHSQPNQAREEVKTFDGTVRGSYSYVDPNGKLNQVVYKAGADGFQILGANNLPVAPVANIEPVKDTPEVIAARADFARKFEEAKEAAAKEPEEKSRRRRSTENSDEPIKTLDVEKIGPITYAVPAFHPYASTLVRSVDLKSTLAHLPVFSAPVAVPLLGKTTVKTSELKPLDDKAVPASTKLAEIKETEKEIITPISYSAPLTYSTPLAYSAFPYSSYPYTAYPYHSNVISPYGFGFYPFRR